MRHLLLALILMCGLPSLVAQEKEYMYEIGGGLGTGWGYGDINRSRAVYNPALAYDLLFRYNTNLRWAIAIDLSSNRLKGDSHDFGNTFPLNAHLTYDRQLWQLAIRPEFTFWNYGWGSDYREKHRFAPFLTAGLGFGLATGKSSEEDKNSSTLSIPLGLGLKWKIAPRWDMQLTCLWAKTFSDDVDGIADPYSLGTTIPVNTEWVSTVMMSITFSFKERCLQCHNQNE